MDAGGVVSSSWNVMSSGEESEKIMADANTIAEQKMKINSQHSPIRASQAWKGQPKNHSIQISHLFFLF